MPRFTTHIAITILSNQKKINLFGAPSTLEDSHISLFLTHNLIHTT
jgi:hypothetical protein